MTVLAVTIVASGAAAQAPEIDWAAELAEAGAVHDVGMRRTVAGASVAAAGLGVTLAFGGERVSVTRRTIAGARPPASGRS